MTVYILLNFLLWKLRLILTILSSRRQEVLQILTRYLRLSSPLFLQIALFSPCSVTCLVDNTILTPNFVFFASQFVSETFLISGRKVPDIIISLHAKFGIYLCDFKQT